MNQRDNAFLVQEHLERADSMEIKELKKSVYTANMALKESGLVLFTFGNVSGIDRNRKMMVIKPSGVPYAKLSPNSMVCVSLETGEVVDSDLNPSSDTDTHLEIYRASGEKVQFLPTYQGLDFYMRCLGYSVYPIEAFLLTLQHWCSLKNIDPFTYESNAT